MENETVVVTKSFGSATIQVQATKSVGKYAPVQRTLSTSIREAVGSDMANRIERQLHMQRNDR